MSLKSLVSSSKSAMEQAGEGIKNAITELKSGCWEGPAFLGFVSKIDTMDSSINLLYNHFEIYSAVANIVEALEMIAENLEKLNKYKSGLSEPNAELDVEITKLEEEKRSKVEMANNLLNGITDTGISEEILTSATAVLNSNVVSSIQTLIENCNSKFKFEPTCIEDIDLGPGKYMTDADWENSPYITKEEFKCKCGRGDCDGYPAQISKVLIEDLNKIRFYYGKPIIINSGLRCLKHNKAVGGAMDSNHTKGRAADIVIDGVSSNDLLKYIINTYGKHNADSYTGSSSGYSGMDGVVHFAVKDIDR